MVRRNKKGTLQDLGFIMGVLLFFGLIVLIGFKFVNEVNSKFQETDILPAKGENAVQEINDLFPGAIDNSFLFLMMGLMLVTLILASLVAIHPVFFVFYFLFLGIIIFIGGAMSNIYQQAAEQAVLADVAAQLTYTSHILQYLPIIIGIFGFVLAIVLYRTYQTSI